MTHFSLATSLALFALGRVRHPPRTPHLSQDPLMGIESLNDHLLRDIGLHRPLNTKHRGHLVRF